MNMSTFTTFIPRKVLNVFFFNHFSIFHSVHVEVPNCQEWDWVGFFFKLLIRLKIAKKIASKTEH